MSALSDGLEYSLLNHYLRGISHVPTASLEVGLFTSDPGDFSIIGEVSGGSYARAAVANNVTSFPPCSITGVPTKANGVTIAFPTATVSWGTVSHWAIFEPVVNITGASYSVATGATVTVISSSSITVGMALVGTGIPVGAYVASITDGTHIVMSAAATATGTAFACHRMLFHGQLDIARYVAVGDPPKIAVGEMTISLSNSSGGGLTDFAKRKGLDLTLGAISYPSPTTVYAAAGTALTGEAFSEWVDPGYTRQSLSFNPPSGGSALNSTLVVLNNSVVSNIGPLTALGIFDDASVGNALFLGPLGASRSIAIGNSAKLPVGSVSITFN
jgi:hypothetical protein